MFVSRRRPKDYYLSKALWENDSTCLKRGYIKILKNEYIII